MLHPTAVVHPAADIGAQVEVGPYCIIGEHVSIGRVLSTLARAALQPAAPSPTMRNGLPVLPNARSARPVTLDLVNQLRDETP